MCCCERTVRVGDVGQIVARDTRSPAGGRAWDGVDTASARPGDAVGCLGAIEEKRPELGRAA
jgi:hypothetical protein